MDVLIAIFPSTVAAVAAVASAYISNKTKEDAAKNAKGAEEYRERRERIDQAKWKVLLSTMEGVTVLLHQAKGEKLNGNVDAALERIAKATDELTEVQIKELTDK